MTTISCPVCESLISTSNIIDHLRRRHKDVIISPAQATAAGLVACTCGQPALTLKSLKAHQARAKCTAAPPPSVPISAQHPARARLPTPSPSPEAGLLPPAALNSPTRRAPENSGNRNFQPAPAPLPTPDNSLLPCETSSHQAPPQPEIPQPTWQPSLPNGQHMHTSELSVQHALEILLSHAAPLENSQHSTSQLSPDLLLQLEPRPSPEINTRPINSLQQRLPTPPPEGFFNEEIQDDYFPSLDDVLPSFAPQYASQENIFNYGAWSQG